MGYLAAADVTVTLTPQNLDFMGARRVSFPTVAFGTGILQYPALGIPMPVIAYFGMKKAIERVFIEQPANGFIYHFDRTNHKLRIFNGAGAGTIAVANHANITLPTPTGNVAAPANHVNIAVPAPANHSHGLIIAANSQGAEDVSVGISAANNALVSNIANATTIAGGNATLGGVQDGAVPAPANIANLTHSAPAFTGDAPANLANMTHTVSGAAAAGALAEMVDGVAPAATTLYMQVIGQ